MHVEAPAWKWFVSYSRGMLRACLLSNDAPKLEMAHFLRGDEFDEIIQRRLTEKYYYKLNKKPMRLNHQCRQ